MTLCPYPPSYCRCGDQLIHNSARGPHESSSAFGQHIHDHYPTTFYCSDIDAAILKQSTHILRVIEHKEPGREIKPSQSAILSLLAIGIDVLTNVHYLNPQSGAFAVWSSPPFATGTVGRIAADSHYRLIDRSDLSAVAFDQFKTGDVMT